MCHRESSITVLSRCPDTFDQIVYTYSMGLWKQTPYMGKLVQCILLHIKSKIQTKDMEFLSSTEEKKERRDYKFNFWRSWYQKFLNKTWTEMTMIWPCKRRMDRIRMIYMLQSLVAIVTNSRRWQQWTVCSSWDWNVNFSWNKFLYSVSQYKCNCLLYKLLRLGIFIKVCFQPFPNDMAMDF
jgi:hypothetical protein